MGKSLVLIEKWKKFILKNGMCKGKGGSGVSSLYGHINLWIIY